VVGLLHSRGRELLNLGTQSSGQIKAKLGLPKPPANCVSERQASGHLTMLHDVGTRQGPDRESLIDQFDVTCSSRRPAGCMVILLGRNICNLTFLSQNQSSRNKDSRHSQVFNILFLRRSVPGSPIQLVNMTYSNTYSIPAVLGLC